MSSGSIEVELVRGKNYPQSEDDANPCSTQVTVTVVDASTGALLSAAQTSSLQINSNAPFYNDTLNFRVEGVPDAVSALIVVSEHSRQKKPFILFHGRQALGLSKIKAKQRFVIPLFADAALVNSTDGDIDALEVENGGNAPFLTARVQFMKDKIVDTSDPYCDVDVSGRQLSLDGSTQLVPDGSQYVWLRLMSDKKWTASFQYELSVVWRSRAPLEGEVRTSTKARRSLSFGAGAAAAAEADSARTLGDIITKKWCCHRTHQVLTRVCIAAEKYGNKVADLTSTPKEEVEFRTRKKERSVLAEQICKAKLEESGNSRLRDWLNRLWVLFATGIDNDPSGPRTLSYEVRKAAHDAAFTEADAIILKACLMFAIVPSLKYDVCQALCEADFRAAPLEKVRELTGFEASQRRATPAQQQFTHVFISVVGSLLDTLTEAEMVKIAAEFKPAVGDANQRIAKGAKSTIGPSRRGEDGSPFKGDGIHIDHLDKLGRRKQTPKFV